MIDRIAIERLYNEDQCQKLIEEFYILLVEYTKNKETEKIEECLNRLNLFAKKIKSRPVYYDNHCLDTDITNFIVETYRQERIKKYQ